MEVVAAQGPAVGWRRVKGLRRRLAAWVHLAARAWADLLGYRLPNECLLWIDDFRPDVVFTTLASIRFIRLGLQVAERDGLPIIADFRDDFPSALHRDTWLGMWPRWVLKRELGRLLKRTAYVTAGSEELARRYSRSGRLPFAEFIPAVDDALLQREPGVPTQEEAAPVLFAYVGGLHLGRIEPLLALGRAIAEVNGEDERASLLVYAPQAHLEEHRASLERVPGIRIAGTLKPSEVPMVLSAADVLVHVESFDVEIQRFTRLSVSTKIPQYMAAGRPILAHGPSGLSSLRHVEKAGCGIVVENQDPEALRDAVQRLSARSDLRERLGRSGWVAAKDWHDAGRERIRFREVVRRSALSRGGRGGEDRNQGSEGVARNGSDRMA